METKTITLKSKENFHGTSSSKIVMHEPKVLHLKQIGDNLQKPSGIYELIEKTCNLTSDEFNNFSTKNCFLLVGELNDFLGAESLIGIKT